MTAPEGHNRMTNTADANQPSVLIDLRCDEQIDRWCDKLQCSEEELRRAVADVGDLPLQVAEHLGLTKAALT